MTPFFSFSVIRKLDKKVVMLKKNSFVYDFERAMQQIQFLHTLHSDIKHES